MKSRETFEQIRSQKKERFSMRMRLILAVQAQLLFCILVAKLTDTLISDILFPKWNVPHLVVMIVTSMLVSGVIMNYVSHAFLDPMKKMQEAIGKVADGDFSVRLETDSKAKEVREIFSGFNLMVHELNATEVLQTDFVSNVSHEFKTPINAIEGYAMLLQDSEHLSQEEQAQYVDKVLFNTQRLSTLVGNILLLSKIDNQSIQTKQNTFRLDEQIRQAIVLLEPEWVKKDVEFEVDMEDIEYCGNEGLLHHVWYNLIGNAIKFNPRFGLIRIRLKNKGEDILFEIEDSGPGISEEAKKHIFDKFYQGDSCHKEEGNGLGLALVKKVLNLSNGEITAENIPGGGCRFTVVLKKQ